MRLFTKYNRVNIIATIATFLVSSVAFYFVLFYVLRGQLDVSLTSEQQEFTEYVKLHNQLPEIQNTKHQWITVTKVDKPLKRRTFCSKTHKAEHDDENENVRQLTFSIKAGAQYYNVTVSRSETETEDLLQLIILVTLVVIGLILVVNYIINRQLVSRLWQPFYNTIDRIKNYTIVDEEPLKLPKENIDEIALLNESLNQFTRQIHRDYRALKSFTENASHEMQTPLAVIRSKIDVLLQNEDLQQQSIQQLLAIEDAARRLSKLHQSLLLLTKLENRQFAANEPVNMRQVLQSKINEWQDLVASKKLAVTINAEEVIIDFHPHLAEILVNNLLNNALRYTNNEGEIAITLTQSGLKVANTASAGALEGGKVFQRFYKATGGGDGTGLGLAIIKEICSLAGFEASYLFKNGQHIFSIYFRQQT